MEFAANDNSPKVFWKVHPHGGLCRCSYSLADLIGAGSGAAARNPATPNGE